jgi:hypothetical protein
MIIRVIRSAFWLLMHPGFAVLFYSLLLDLRMLGPNGPVNAHMRSRLMSKLWILIKNMQSASRG